jgi:hypothetical protein
MTALERSTALPQKEAVSFWQIIGPLSLLCTLALAVGNAVPFDLLFMGVIGLYLSAKWQMRGFVYALTLLAIGAGVKHLLISSNHLWELGLEASLVCAFFITASAFEQGTSVVQSLNGQLESQKASLQNLEEELVKERESAIGQQVAVQDKVAELQKELEELQADHSSLLILNEVLRKTSAQQLEEKESSNELALNAQRHTALLEVELVQKEEEIKRLSDTEGLIAENSNLLKELNTARYDKEQTYLINETLVRLHAKETVKAKEYFEQIHAEQEEKRKVQEALSYARNELEMLSKHVEQISEERARAQNELLQLNELQTQRNFLQERLAVAEAELAHLREHPAQEADPQAERQVQLLQQERTYLAEQLGYAQEKNQALAQTELLFKQLKKQFEEKNQVLQATRSELFKTDTELHALKIERELMVQTSPIPESIAEELQVLEKRIDELKEENQELQELIHVLNHSLNPAESKKKTENEIG